VFFGAFALAAPAVAPDLLRYTVFAPSFHTAPDRPGAAAPNATPAKRGDPQPLQPASRSSGPRQVSLRADQVGQFEAHAVINGLTVPVIVDTGATTVALSADTARRLGVMPPQSAFRLAISTANGLLYAAPVTLSDINVGGIVVRNVEAVVVPGSALPVSLLGMTFLSRISKFEIAGGQLTLHQ
jgi:aspartyl protease family protein